MQHLESLNQLVHLLTQANSVYHGILSMENRLKNTFKKLDWQDLEKVHEGQKAYLIKNESALLAFSIGKNPKKGIKIVGSHSDSPALKIKPNALLKRGESFLLNTEVYGGAILHTWFDRPLSLAGRAYVLYKNERHSVLVDFKKPLLTIPSLAIHMNRQINEGQAVQRQKTLLPVLALQENFETFSFEDLILDEIVQDHANFERQSLELLAYDLYLYDVQKPVILGLQEEWIQSPKLDNLAMASASIEALLQSPEHEGINVIFVADNEEVGSRTQQGANSLLLRQSLELICKACGYSQGEFLKALDEGLLISADLAHAVHPHYPEVADPSNQPKINHGPVIKVAANQSYATDAASQARFIHACKVAQMPYQIFVNHSDRPGGSTIGPISTAYLTMPTVDIGTAIWGMHSIRETGGTKDNFYLTEILKCFFEKSEL